MARKKKRPDGFPKVTLKNVCRAEPRFFGWRVNIKRGSKDHVQYFADGLDGPFESLRAAIRWRDLMWARLGPPTHVPTRPRGDSGVVGVRRDIQRLASGRIAESWVAKWIDAKRKRHGRAFSIDKFGDDEAFRRAVAARKAGVAATKKERERLMHEVLHTHGRLLGPAPRIGQPVRS